MKKNISRNPLWPDWYNGKKIDEVQFGRAFLEQWPLKCVNGTLYTLDGPVEDESEIKQRILENRTASTSITACTICRTAPFRRAACSARTACL